MNSRFNNLLGLYYNAKLKSSQGELRLGPHYRDHQQEPSCKEAVLEVLWLGEWSCKVAKTASYGIGVL